MVERKICVFCGGDIEPGTGKMYIKKDGTAYTFCSHKCKKNLIVLHRNPRLLKWTTSYIKETVEVDAGEKTEEKPKEEPSGEKVEKEKSASAKKATKKAKKEE